MTEHTYPSNYPKGTHWAVDRGWEIIDMVKPGVLTPELRAYLAGSIAGALMRVATEGPPKVKEKVDGG